MTLHVLLYNYPFKCHENVSIYSHKCLYGSLYFTSTSYSVYLRGLIHYVRYVP